jgi:hypothetical protein
MPCNPPYQDYDAMIELVEALPDHDQILKAPVQYQYAFALNRRNSPGYRDKALKILEEVRSKFTHKIDIINTVGNI